MAAFKIRTVINCAGASLFSNDAVWMQVCIFFRELAHIHNPRLHVKCISKNFVVKYGSIRACVRVTCILHLFRGVGVCAYFSLVGVNAMLLEMAFF